MGERTGLSRLEDRANVLVKSILTSDGDLRKRANPAIARQALEIFFGADNKPESVLAYPLLQRVIKAVVINHPEIYPEMRMRIEEMLQMGGGDEQLRVANQARLIDLLLEVTEGDFIVAGDEDFRQYDLLKENLKPAFARRNPFGVLGGDSRFGNPRYNVAEFLAGRLYRKALVSEEYLLRGWNPKYVKTRLLIDLALSASGIYDGGWKIKTFAPDRAFDQGLLDVLRRQSSNFIRIIEQRIDQSFRDGIITPPPISLTLRQIIKQLDPTFDLENSDPAYHEDIIRRTLKEHAGAVDESIMQNPLWVTSYDPSEYPRYKRIFQVLKEKIPPDDVANILEMGCSTFGAALGLLEAFSDSFVVGCDLLPMEAQLARCSPAVRDRVMRQEGLSYVQWDIAQGITSTVGEALGMLGGKVDIAALLNSAYPHLVSIVTLEDGWPSPLRGRVAALEAALLVSRRAGVVAGGFAQKKMFSAENPNELKPSDKGNAWIWEKGQDGGLSLTGLLFT